MKRMPFFAVALLFLCGLSIAAASLLDPATSGNEDRAQLWNQVRQAQSSGLPKTAAELLVRIYDSAVADKDFDAALKAWCYRVRTEGQINQPELPYVIRKMQSEVPDLPAEIKPLAQVIHAKWFLNYYTQNRWKFAQRSQTGTAATGEQAVSDDFESWDLPQILGEIDRLFQQALSAAETLKRTPISDVSDLLKSGTLPDSYRPTVFDFVAHEAIGFYSLDEQITRRQGSFDITSDSPIFASTDDFLAWEPATEDDDSTLLKAVSIFKQLLTFHARDDNPDARLDAELSRLRFGNRVAKGSDVASRYRSALQRFADQNVKHPLSSAALALQAQSFRNENQLVQAHQSATIGLNRFPESPGGKQCFNIVQQIEAPSLQTTTEQVWNAANPELKVTYKNLKEVHFRLVPYDYRSWPWARGNPISELRNGNKKRILQPPVATWSETLPATPDYQPNTVSLPVNLDFKPGSYILQSSYTKDFADANNVLSATQIWVTDLSVITRRTGEKTASGMVLHAITGLPIVGAKVSVYSWRYDRQGNREVFEGATETDADGMYQLACKNRGQHLIYVESGPQKFAVIDNVSEYGRQNKRLRQTFFFTDRSIYRPGQTVQFKGICVDVNKGSNVYSVDTTPGEVRVQLLDPNRQQIEERAFRTNEFGSFSGSFSVPAGRGTGRMSLRVVNNPPGNAWFRVEEYKRPKFFVDVEKPKQQTRLEQPVSVTVKATAYTGAVVDGAKVSYRVVRNVRYPQWWLWRCWYMPTRSESQEIVNGSGVTDSDGTFEVQFTASPDKSVDRDAQPVFAFTVYADVTDTAGETRSSTQVVNVGYNSMQASLKADDWLVASDEIELKLSTTTLDGEAVSTQGTLSVYPLKNPDTVARKKMTGYWPGQSVDLSDIKSWETMAEATIEKEVTTDESGEATANVSLSKGAYKAIYETTDDAGQIVTSEVPFQVVDPAAEQFSTRIASHFSAESWSLEPGQELMALWGTGYDSGRAYVEFEHRGKVVDSYWTQPGKTQTPIRFAIEEKHRGGLQVRVTYVRENRAYLESKRIEVPWSNKDLKIKWEHFVSKLTPGGKETWTAIITGPKAEKTAVEMVAGMYDASLDAFAGHSWGNRIKSLFYRDYSRTNLNFRNQLTYLSTYANNFRTDSRSAVATYRRFDEQIVQQWYGPIESLFDDNSRGVGGGFGGGMRGMGGGGMGGMRMATASMEMGDEAMPAPMSRAAGASMGMGGMGGGITSGMSMDKSAASESGSDDSAAAPDVKLDNVTARTNLQETAFFFPHLLTDENGTVRIEFEIPEALTKWKFLGFAHDTQLRTATLTDEMTTSKDLMVGPNPPRFLREGDELEFSVKLTNVSDIAQTGTVRLTLADAITEASLDEAFGNQRLEQAFEVPAGQSKSVFWKLSVPDYVGVLTWKAVGATETLSDGEEGYLPVLSKRILVVESLPLPIRGNQTKNFEFSELEKIASSDSLKSQSLTVQMTSNPSWYAVMALPYLMEYPHQCNEQIFSRLYANALGRHIVTSQPKIKRIFEQWRGTEALDSPLEKNADLRNVLIEESPWLRAAKKESQSRRDVANLFDENRITNEVANATRQLAERQYADGSWSWFPGGKPNQFITLYVTTGFGRLRHLGVEVDETAAIKSLNWLDNGINQQYQNLKTQKKLDRNNLTSSISLYLYGRSFFLSDQDISDQNRTAVDYFLGQAKQHWLSVSKMSQAQLAIATKRFGDTETPTAIMKSLTERSQSSEEMGRFWRETGESWWWYRAPIETQAMLIEAYSEVADDADAVEDCKIWLLKQKQTQNWKTTKATADAVYALLLRGADRLSSDKLVEVSLGGITVEPDDIEAGTGFYQQRFAGNEVTANMKTIEVKKSDDGIAWGSVHWQYLEDVSKIEPYEGTPLTLKKALFLKKNTASGPTITPITGPVEVGDEIVSRVEIRVDRDMEYVHLKDQRGSGTEPVNVLSRYKWQDGLGYYESTRDTASHFFIDYLSRGTYVFEYSVRVQHRGEYQSGIATLQCMYAPEFNSHSNSVKIEVE